MLLVEGEADFEFLVAVVHEVLEDDRGTINLPIEREAELDIKRIVIDSGLPSVTHYEVLERFANHTFIKIF